MRMSENIQRHIFLNSMNSNNNLFSHCSSGRDFLSRNIFALMPLQVLLDRKNIKERISFSFGYLQIGFLENISFQNEHSKSTSRCLSVCLSVGLSVCLIPRN